MIDELAPAARPEVAVGVIAVQDDALLLIRRGHGPAAGRWSVPSGRIERGETAAEAIVRELQEETGLAGVCGPLIGWAIAELAIGVLRALLVPATTAIVARGGGVDAIVTAQAVQTLLGTALGAGLVVWLAYALVTLARPPKPVDVPREPPYR